MFSTSCLISCGVASTSVFLAASSFLLGLGLGFLVLGAAALGAGLAVGVDVLLYFADGGAFSLGFSDFSVSVIAFKTAFSFGASIL